MEVVCKAHDPQIDCMVALNMLREDRVISHEFAMPFIREAKAIGRILHPAIITVFEVGQNHDTLSIAMEFFQGCPLGEVMKGRTFSAAEAVTICAQVLVDAHFKRSTPLDRSLAPEAYEVRLDLPGHDPWEARIQVSEKDPPSPHVQLLSVN